jgi:type I restriction enzyme, S subunit
VGEIADLVRTTVDPDSIDPLTPAVGLEHIPRRQLTLDAWGEAGSQGSRKGVFSKDDLLFGRIRPYLHKVSIAPIPGICSTDALVIRPSEEHWGQAVEAISSDEFVANATQTSNGTKMPRANWQVIKTFPIVIPPHELSQQFTRMVRDSLGLTQSLMFQSRELVAARDLLLPRLVTGQVDVSSLDADSPVQGSVA